MLFAPFMTAVSNKEEDLPYELKLILLADVFNVIAHNLNIFFDEPQGKDFWFGLKNEVLLELINIVDKNSIYITDETKHEGRIVIFFKATVQGDTKFFSWHTTSDLIEKIPGFREGRYESEELKEEIKNFLPADKINNIKYNLDLDQAIKIANYQIYNQVIHVHREFEKTISEIFSMQLKDEEKSFEYEGGGNYEDATVIENNSEEMEVEDEMSKLIAEIENADTQEDVEKIVERFEEIKDAKILKLKGKYPVFFVQLNINGKVIVVNCKKGFECKYKGKCYTKIQIAQIRTTGINEIEEKEAMESKKKENAKPKQKKRVGRPKKSQNLIVDEIEAEPVATEEQKNEQEQLIRAEEIEEYIKNNPEKITEVIKGMTKEQKMLIMKTIICSSDPKALGEIFQELFNGDNKGGNRNGGVTHE